MVVEIVIGNGEVRVNFEPHSGQQAKRYRTVVRSNNWNERGFVIHNSIIGEWLEQGSQHKVFVFSDKVSEVVETFDRWVKRVFLGRD